MKHSYYLSNTTFNNKKCQVLAVVVTCREFIIDSCPVALANYSIILKVKGAL